MKNYTQRTYRQRFSNERWHGFVVKYKETDVWIGVDKVSFRAEMPEFALKIIQDLRTKMDAYLIQDQQFTLSLTPYEAKDFAPQMAKELSEISFKTGVGPMAAIAGGFATHLAKALQKQFRINEILIENGGDIYADIQQDIDVCIFAGESPLSEKIGLHIDAEKSPLGICTSSGTVGHSLSFGTADAVMIVCPNALLADAYATAYANRVQVKDDIQKIAQQIENQHDILAALFVKDDQMGIVGEFELKLFA